MIQNFNFCKNKETQFKQKIIKSISTRKIGNVTLTHISYFIITELNF